MVLAERGRLPWPEVLDLAVQVCAALKHAHDHGIIHRDIKPSNLMRTTGGAPPVVKLTDFGIAHVFAGKHLTRTGTVIGTAEYLSPEQAEGPATLMSRLLRKELEEQNHGGPVRRFFNRPVVVAVLFVLCAGALVWTFWPTDLEKLYAEGRALMESDDPEDWEAGWEKL